MTVNDGRFLPISILTLTITPMYIPTNICELRDRTFEFGDGGGGWME